MPQPTCPCEGQTLDRHLQPTMLGFLCNGPLHGYALVKLLIDAPKY